MQKGLELFLRNKNVVSQNQVIVENNPLKFMRGGIWCTVYTVHIGCTIAGLSLRGKISNYANGVVETCLVFSTYGDYNISLEEYNRRENIISHITRRGGIHENEPQIQWFS